MILNIKYFGILTEVTKCQEETFMFSQSTVADLLNALFNKYPLLEERNFQVAQRQTLVSKDTIISEVEIALLPPFSGG